MKDPGIGHPNEDYLRKATGLHITDPIDEVGRPAPRTLILYDAYGRPVAVVIPPR